MKKISIFTGARSEYGPLKPLIKEFLQNDQYFQTELVVAGGHLVKEQGYTIDEIIADGFPIGAKISHVVEGTSASAISKSNAYLQLHFADYLEQNQPDLLVVLGDRSELIPVVSSALFQNIPIAHISGGEVTEGATDNQVRHAVSKMSHLHFPATEIYGDNLKKMGEEAWRICVSGEPGLDEILTLPLPTKEAFLERFQLPNDRPLLLSTFHSETIGKSIDAAFLKDLVNQICQSTEYHLLFTAANTDVGGVIINETLRELAANNSRVTFVESLGRTNYYTAQKVAAVMLGNSSSGLIEAHSFGIPVVNVGSRQDGRLRNANCVDVAVDVSAILKALQTATDPAFKAKFSLLPNIYGDGKSSERIVDFVRSTAWDKLLLKRSTF